MLSPHLLDVEGSAGLAVYSCTGKPRSTSAGTPPSGSALCLTLTAGSTATEVA